MRLEHEFTVPVPVEEAWKVLLDVEKVAPCMPGATLLSVDGEEFTGSVKVKVGPIQVTYKGKARFASIDETAHRAVIEASAKEARGSGTAAATVATHLHDAGATTRVVVETDLNITGRPAQFGRGVMADVGAKLIGQFADCLADELGGTSRAAPSGAPAEAATGAPAPSDTQPLPEHPAATAGPAAASEPAAAPVLPPTGTGMTEPAPAPATPLAGGPTMPARPARPPAEPIDLLQTAGGPVAKRLAPVAAVVAVVLLILWWRRRR